MSTAGVCSTASVVTTCSLHRRQCSLPFSRAFPEHRALSPCVPCCTSAVISRILGSCRDRRLGVCFSSPANIGGHGAVGCIVPYPPRVAIKPAPRDVRQKGCPSRGHIPPQAFLALSATSAHTRGVGKWLLSLRCPGGSHQTGAKPICLFSFFPYFDVR